MSVPVATSTVDPRAASQAQASDFSGRGAPLSSAELCMVGADELGAAGWTLGEGECPGAQERIFSLFPA